MVLNDFLEKFFIKPITNPTIQGYNPVNTIVYGAILLITAFYIIYPYLNKKETKFDLKFALALTPYILLGISIRAINSASLLGNLIKKTPNPLELGFWTFTPGIWILVFLITIIGLFYAKKMQKKGKKFNEHFAGFGLICSMPVFIFTTTHFSNWTPFIGAIIATIIFTTTTIFVVKNILKQNWLNEKINYLVIGGQALDSTATAIAISFYSFSEQHFVSNAILQINPVLFIGIKLVLITTILYYIEKEIKEEKLKGFIKIFLIILGLATGGASLIKLGLV